MSLLRPESCLRARTSVILTVAPAKRQPTRTSVEVQRSALRGLGALAPLPGARRALALSGRRRGRGLVVPRLEELRPLLVRHLPHREGAVVDLLLHPVELALPPGLLTLSLGLRGHASKVPGPCGAEARPAAVGRPDGSRDAAQRRRSARSSPGSSSREKRA